MSFTHGDLNRWIKNEKIQKNEKIVKIDKK